MDLCRPSPRHRRLLAGILIPLAAAIPHNASVTTAVVVANGAIDASRYTGVTAHHP